MRDTKARRLVDRFRPTPRSPHPLTPKDAASVATVARVLAVVIHAIRRVLRLARRRAVDAPRFLRQALCAHPAGSRRRFRRVRSPPCSPRPPPASFDRAVSPAARAHRLAVAWISPLMSSSFSRLSRHRDPASGVYALTVGSR